MRRHVEGEGGVGFCAIRSRCMLTCDPFPFYLDLIKPPSGLE